VVGEHLLGDKQRCKSRLICRLFNHLARRVACDKLSFLAAFFPQRRGSICLACTLSQQSLERWLVAAAAATGFLLLLGSFAKKVITLRARRKSEMRRRRALKAHGDQYDMNNLCRLLLSHNMISPRGFWLTYSVSVAADSLISSSVLLSSSALQGISQQSTSPNLKAPSSAG
jgi:hypothetical protein